VTVTISIERLESGMVLAEPIYNRFGQVLLNKGVRISDRHLNVLKTWGIPQVLVEDGQSTEKQFEINEEMRNRALAKINKRLFWTPKTPLEEEIIQLAIQQAVQHPWP
jgi:hypothetical protein